MHNLGLTDLESLEDETLVIPGLDVDSAMAISIAKGKKKIRNRRLAQIASGAMAFLLIAGVVSVVVFTNESSSPQATTKLGSALKIKTETTTVPSTVPVTEPTTTVAPVPSPKLVVIRSFGSQSACEFVEQPNEDGVMIGSALVKSQPEKFSGKVGERFSVPGGKISSDIVLVVKESLDATNGQYVDLESGFTTSGSFANITTLGFTYCESGLKMTIEPQAGSGYVLNTERW